MTRHILPLLALLTMSLWGQAKFTSHTLKEKLSVKDLTFLATFDRLDVNGDLACGEKNSTTMQTTNLGLRGLIGFDGQNGYQAEAGDNLRYPIVKNALPHQGTMILWSAGLDYAPGEATTDGKNRGNICLASLKFTQGKRNIEYLVYEYANNAYFDWWSSECKGCARAPVPLKGIKKGQWFQLALTWEAQKITAYLNGEKISHDTLPAQAALVADLVPENGPDSFIGIKSPFYDDKHAWSTGIDDVAIYNRPLTALEIRNQYLRLLKDKGSNTPQAYAITLNGINIGRKDKIDRLEAEFDFSGLGVADKQLLKNGKLSMEYTLTGPDARKQSGKWTFSKPMECKILHGVDKVGKYTLETKLGKERVTATIERPDFSWVMNGYGDEDEIPELWRKDFGISGRTITTWNRTYRFGDGPLPEEITAYGKSILTKAPKLLIDGQSPTWQAGEIKREKRWITLNGTGRWKGARLTYSTRIEYDGLIKFDWSIHGAPEISSMRLTWQMGPENHQYLMTPHVNTEQSAKVSFKYPLAAGSDKMLWFVTEKKGGFAYTMVNDANWIYDPSKPVFFADKSTGECRVEMISRKTKMPDDTPYCALFIATPVRPLPSPSRGIQFGDGRGGTAHLVNAGGNGGFMGVFSHYPHPYDFELRAKNTAKNTASVYGAADTLSTHEKEAVYLRKYWEVPGAYSYNMPYHLPIAPGKYRLEHYFSLSACSSTVINDYYLWGQYHLYNHKYGDRVWQVYYDICGDSLCGSRLHGCCYKDKFGREVKTFVVLTKRDLIRRTVALAHKYGKTVMLHAQWDFIPMLHGMTDYWFPGEQFTVLLRRNPYGYTDEIPDALFSSELNRDVLGVGIIHLPSLGHTDGAMKTNGVRYTESMLCMLQSHDIETSEYYMSTAPTRKIWDILKKYGAYSPQAVCRRFYEPQEITSDNSGLRITSYRCPGDKTVLFIANKEVRPNKATIDISKIKAGNFEAMEEYTGKPVQVTDGKFELRVPPRSFRIVAFPPIRFYPHSDAMNKIWPTWQNDSSDTQFSLIDQGGIDNTPCLRLSAHKTGDGCFLNFFPVKPGQRYRLSIKARHSMKGQRLSLAFQGRKSGALVGEAPIKTGITSDGTWQTVILESVVPTEGKWGTCDNILVTLGGSGTNCTIDFDDFQMEELR